MTSVNYIAAINLLIYSACAWLTKWIIVVVDSVRNYFFLGYRLVIHLKQRIEISRLLDELCALHMIWLFLLGDNDKYYYDILI